MYLWISGWAKNEWRTPKVINREAFHRSLAMRGRDLRSIKGRSSPVLLNGRAQFLSIQMKNKVPGVIPRVRLIASAVSLAIIDGALEDMVRIGWVVVFIGRIVSFWFVNWGEGRGLNSEEWDWKDQNYSFFNKIYLFIYLFKMGKRQIVEEIW